MVTGGHGSSRLEYPVVVGLSEDAGSAGFEMVGVVPSFVPVGVRVQAEPQAWLTPGTVWNRLGVVRAEQGQPARAVAMRIATSSRGLPDHSGR
jgi:hypothetical protein